MKKRTLYKALKPKKKTETNPKQTCPSNLKPEPALNRTWRDGISRWAHGAAGRPAKEGHAIRR